MQCIIDYRGEILQRLFAKKSSVKLCVELRGLCVLTCSEAELTRMLDGTEAQRVKVGIKKSSVKLCVGLRALCVLSSSEAE